MRKTNLPNFFIVGTGKAGTTSLYNYLQQHPQIYMSPIKEPCYFASEICPENLAESHLILFRRGRALKMDPENRRYLVHYYRNDIRKLASLLNRDLSAWLV